MKKLLNIFALLFCLSALAPSAHAGGGGPGCAGLPCGNPDRSNMQFRPDRQFISDRDLIWDWSKLLRSWGESTAELDYLTAGGPVRNAMNTAANMWGVRDVLGLMGEMGNKLKDIYGDYYYEMSGGMSRSGYTPFEQSMRNFGEGAFVSGEMAAVGNAVGGVAGAGLGAARALGTGLAELAGSGPALATTTGGIIPQVAGGAGVAIGPGAGIGGGIGEGLGISQALQEGDDPNQRFKDSIHRSLGISDYPQTGPVQSFGPSMEELPSYLRGHVKYILKTLEKVSTGGTEIVDLYRQFSMDRHVHPLTRADWVGWHAVDITRRGDPARFVFKFSHRGLEWDVVNHYQGVLRGR